MSDLDDDEAFDRADARLGKVMFFVLGMLAGVVLVAAVLAVVSG